MITRKQIQRALETLGVVQAASASDPARWSASDLGTDLAPLLNELDADAATVERVGQKENQRQGTQKNQNTEPSK
jgi:hypothetical protein